jgi:hypothetical protein
LAARLRGNRLGQPRSSIMSRLRPSVLLVTTLCCISLVASVVRGVEAPEPVAAPVVPLDVTGKEGVKAYLMVVARQCKDAATDLKTHADAYAALVAKHGDVSKAAVAEPKVMSDLIKQLRDDYRRLDSFGYEYVEGIVAGVPSLAAYDVELDAGLPARGAGPDDNIAPVKIVAGPLTLDREGSLNNFLIEPTVFGTNPRFSAGPVALMELSDKLTLAPNPALLVALADYAVDGYDRLYKSADAWQPTDRDCFAALAAMTPTLADYFEDWKESKLSGSAAGGRFVAVSRVSDMRGIMASTRLIWQGLDAQVAPADAALAGTVSLGYDQIMDFIDTVETREKQGHLTAEQIDAMGSQAKEKADKLTAQVVEAAALLKIEVGLAQ